MVTDQETKEKSLDKMTAKELREVAKEIPDIKGVHGMKKDELLTAIKKSRGIEEKKPPKKVSSVQDFKKIIRELKQKRADALKSGDSKTATIIKRRISRLKKKTRRAA